jgi:hypothetical protein
VINGLLLEPAAHAFVLERPRVIIEPDILTSYAGQDAICSRLVDLKPAEQMTIKSHCRSMWSCCSCRSRRLVGASRVTWRRRIAA